MTYMTAEIIGMRNRGMTQRQIAQETGMTIDQVRWRLRSLPVGPPAPRLQASPYPRYDNPLSREGDALILPDTEFPFHNVDFLNRVFDLAQAWGIRDAIIAGDVLHFDQFSQWEANWIANAKNNSLTEDKERAFREKIQALPPELQGPLLEELNSITDGEQEQSELSASKQCLNVLGQLFDHVDYIIGNHDDRFLRALNSPLMPHSLLDFIGLGENPKWRIAPFYFGLLTSGGETFRIEHPKSAAANTAVRLADKYETSIIMGHSHAQSFNWSTSGRHFAIQAGCCVDETRLPYAAQRSTNRPAHALGAVIIRDGWPWLLCERSPWDQLMQR